MPQHPKLQNDESSKHAASDHPVADLTINTARIVELVTAFKAIDPQQRRALNESQTCKDFILPLFAALGWRVYSDEVATEENIGGKRADYTFRLNGVAKFFLEAKKPNVDLRQENFAEQAISYAWHRSVPWAILTNFETLKVFSAEWDEVDPDRSLVFEVKYDDYATSEKLAMLSRKSIESGVLDSWAENEFKKPKRENVDTQLAKDLLHWRDLLSRNFAQWNSKAITNKQIAKVVQTLLDRLIFIRTTEDRHFENEHLRELLREARVGGKSDLEKELKSLFEKYNGWYDSKLFEPGQISDEVEYEESSLRTVLNGLYKNARGIRYDFAKINADVLGSIYEQYLGQIQQGDAKNSKRKQQGIYYTPRYVVDFIVRNTVLETIKDRSADEIAELRILDPACGSGSFLTRAFEAVDSSLRKQGWDDAGTRLTVTPQCVYGVDLDDEAVEIAQLNLLLRMVYQRELLPNLTNNIECGNSLLFGSPEELKKVFGDGWRDKRPFDWHGRFSGVFEKGGFDAIIGNPPYIKEYVDKAAFDGLHDSPYYQGKMDIWTLFACQAIDHLKEGGWFSFIAPNSWLTNAGASIFRDKILREGEIASFIDFGDFKVFEDAGIQTMIFVFRKCTPRSAYHIKYAKVINSDTPEEAVAEFLNSNGSITIDGIRGIDLQFEPQKYIGKTISFIDADGGSVIDQMEHVADFKLTDSEIAQGIVPNPDVVNARNIKEIPDAATAGIKVGDGVFAVPKSILHLGPGEERFLRPLYDTDEIGRYYFDPINRRELIYIGKKEAPPIDGKIISHLKKFQPIMEKRRENESGSIRFYNLHWPRDERFFKAGPKIVALRKSALPSFSYTEEPAYVMLTFNVIRTERVDMKYLTAVLNSKLADFWFRNRGKVQGDNLQVDKEPLMNFPIKAVTDKKEEDKIVALVDEVMKLNTELHQLDAVLEREACAEIKNQITVVEDQIDAEIYKIYELSPDQIKVLN